MYIIFVIVITVTFVIRVIVPVSSAGSCGIISDADLFIIMMLVVVAIVCGIFHCSY